MHRAYRYGQVVATCMIGMVKWWLLACPPKQAVLKSLIAGSLVEWVACVHSSTACQPCIHASSRSVSTASRCCATLTTSRPCATFVCGLCGCKGRFFLLWLVARVGSLVFLARLVLEATKTWHVLCCGLYRISCTFLARQTRDR